MKHKPLQGHFYISLALSLPSCCPVWLLLAFIWLPKLSRLIYMPWHGSMPVWGLYSFLDMFHLFMAALCLLLWFLRLSFLIFAIGTFSPITLASIAPMSLAMAARCHPSACCPWLCIQFIKMQLDASWFPGINKVSKYSWIFDTNVWGINHCKDIFI